MACAAGTAIILYDIHDGSDVRSLVGHNGNVTRIIFSPNGKRLVSGSEDFTVRIWDPEMGVELLTLRGHLGGIAGLAVSDDGRRLGSVRFRR